MCPLLLTDKRALVAFETPHRCIAIEPKYQKITESLRFLKILHMSDMEEIETTVGEYHPFTFFSLLGNDRRQHIPVLDLRVAVPVVPAHFADDFSRRDGGRTELADSNPRRNIGKPSGLLEAATT